MPPAEDAGPNRHLTNARRALESHDLPAAARHVASALSEDPNRSDSLALLDEILQTADDPLELLSEDELPTTSGLTAVHAYILAEQGRIPEAIDKLLGVILDRPDVLYIDWVLGWLQRTEVNGKLDLDRLAGFLGSLIEQYPALTAPHGGGRETLSRMPLFIQLVRRTHAPDAHFLVVAVALLRRLGNLDEALRLAREAHQLEPDVQTAQAIAATHAARNEVDQALQAFRDALQLEPTDVSARVHLADLLVHNGRIDEAVEQYREILQQEPHQEDARPSLLFLQFVQGGDANGREQLLALADAEPENERAQRLAQQVTPYVGHLPEPPDVTEKLQQPVNDDPARRSSWLPHLEAPSNLLAFDWLRRLEPRVMRVQQPDPRLPRCRVDYLLWRYDGTQPIINLPPSSRAMQAVAEMAAQPFQIDAWWGHARRAARDWTPDEVEELLSVMVYPPGVGGMEQPALWVYRVQIAVALIVAQLESGWENTIRRKALLALANGPMDWTVDAALVALAAVAREEEDAVAEIVDLFRDLRHATPSDGTYCTYPALLWCSLRLPNLSEEERNDIRQRLRRWQNARDAERRRRQAKTLADRGELDKAIAELTEALKLDSDGAEAYRDRAALLLRRNNARGAYDDYNRAMQLQPGTADDHLGRGQAQLKLFRFNEAIADFSEAARLSPWDWQPIYRRGLARLARREHALAIDDFTEVIRLDPERAEAYLQRAGACVQVGRLEQAVGDYTELLRLQPASATVYNSRGRLHLRRGDRVAALTDFQHASELDPQNDNTLCQLAWIWATSPESSLRNAPKAIEYALRACELSQWRKASPIDALAAAHAAIGEFEQAIHHGERALDVASEAERAVVATHLQAYRHGKAWQER